MAVSRSLRDLSVAERGSVVCGRYHVFPSCDGLFLANNLHEKAQHEQDGLLNPPRGYATFIKDIFCLSFYGILMR